MKITVNTRPLKDALRTIDMIFAKSQMKPAEGILAIITAEDGVMYIEASNQGLWVRSKLLLEEMEEAGKVAVNVTNLQKIKFSAKTTDLHKVGRRLNFRSRIKGSLDIVQESQVEVSEREEIDIDFTISTTALIRGVKSTGFTPTNLEKHLSAKLVQEDEEFALMLNDSMRIALFKTDVDVENADKMEIVVPLGFLIAIANRADQTKLRVGSSETAIRVSTDFLEVYHPLKQEELPDVIAYLQMVEGSNKPKAKIAINCPAMVECMKNVSSIVSGSMDFQQRMRVTVDREAMTATLLMKSKIGEAEESFPVEFIEELDEDFKVELSTKFSMEFLNLIKLGTVTITVYEDQALFRSNEDDVTLMMAVFDEE